MEDVSKIFIEISRQLGELNGNMKSVLNTLQDHNARILKLENERHVNCHQPAKADKDVMSWLVEWLLKGLLIALGIIATTSGAGAILSKIFGV